MRAMCCLKHRSPQAVRRESLFLDALDDTCFVPDSHRRPSLPGGKVSTGVTKCASDRESVDVGNFQTVRNLRQYLKVEDDASSEHLRVIQGYILTSATRCRGK